MSISLNSLLSSSGLMPHGMCLMWKPELLILHVVSDTLIALSYFSIPFALAFFVSKRKDLEYRWMFNLFAAFILACGTSHVFDVWTLWRPDSWLRAWSRPRRPSFRWPARYCSGRC